jgi:regulator of sirC expression with transglutaminase-like and TPR domain
LSLFAQGINLPIFGINLPQHFVLGFKDDAFTDKVLFYVNPFSKGSIFNRKEIDHFLEKIKITSKDQFYQPCTNQEIIGRLVRNLIYSYEKLEYPTKVAELRKLQNVLNNSNY